jgi:peptidoglycan/LPS O-acetylase OafA/YrhL
VVVWHYFVGIPGGEASAVASFFRRLFYLGWSGVDLFFVLSGFLIGGILLDNRASPRYFRTFYVRRAFRILPVYVLLLVPFWSARSSVGTSGSVAVATLLEGEIPAWSYGLFVQNLFMAAIGDFGAQWTGITWSLAVEEQFYLVLPLTLFLAPRRFVPGLCLGFVAAAPLDALALRRTARARRPPTSCSRPAWMPVPGVLGARLVREPDWSRRLAGPPVSSGW